MSDMCFDDFDYDLVDCYLCGCTINRWETKVLDGRFCCDECYDLNANNKEDANE